MTTIQHFVCGVIPPHMLARVAPATLEQMRELASGRTRTLLPLDEDAPPAGRRRVYDALRRFELPGKLVISDYDPADADLEALQAWRGSGETLKFLHRVFGRRSIDGRGMRLDATVHYGTGFGNAMWNGRQMVYGDGDGRIFRRFTASLDVIAHELTHGLTQYAAALGYTGQTGALNEHVSDVFGIMVKQYALDQTAEASDWLIGAELFGADAAGCAVRSLALPGSAYFHPILGRDPQPFHMADYVHTDEDNGGVHINSGIPNHAFYLAAMALGGKTWGTLGRIWYAVLTERLTADADFDEFARATIDVAGQLYGIGGKVQRIVGEAWEEVGLPSTTETIQEDYSMKLIPFEKVHRGIVTLNAELEQENTLLPEGVGETVQRVIVVYRGIKPLLAMISTLPFVPSAWRKGVGAFITVLDALAGIDVTAAFKAGKDLEPAA